MDTRLSKASPWSRLRNLALVNPEDPDNQDKTTMKWYSKEEEYLRLMYESSIELSREYMKLYTQMHKIQTRLRIPAIVLSSVSGAASFGSAGFGSTVAAWIAIVVGVINVGIAIIQTYESYIKISDTVAKSLSTSNALKKLSDDIYCEIFIPVEDRSSTGVTFLRDSFSHYQAILEQAPPLELLKFTKGLIGVHELKSKITHELNRRNTGQSLSPFGLRPTQKFSYDDPSAELKIEIIDPPSEKKPDSP